MPLAVILFVCIHYEHAAGVLQDLLRPTLSAWGPIAEVNEWLFDVNGLSLSGALVLWMVVGLGTYFWAKRGKAIQTGFQGLPPKRQKIIRTGLLILLVGLLLTLPQILGLFLSEVLTIVGLYVLLGLGLNIVVGYAGLLDLGYVAFFAIGAYVVGLLTSPELGFFSLSFWGALPFAVIMGILFTVVQRIAEREVETPWGRYSMVSYRDLSVGSLHLALTLGKIEAIVKQRGPGLFLRHQFFVGFLMPALSKAVQRTAFAQAAVDEAAVACALERHRLAHGAYPDSLEALAPQFIAQVPHDVITGQALKYRRAADGQYVLYSVGWNEKDDGGVVAMNDSGKAMDAENGDWVWTLIPAAHAD